MTDKKAYFVELITMTVCYLICFGFAVIIIKGIPGYGEEAGGKRFITAVGYAFCNVIVFIAISLLRLPTKKKLATAGGIVLFEAAISAAIYFINMRYYESVIIIQD